MEYFFSHITSILVAGLIIAAIAILWAFAAAKWQSDKAEEAKEKGEDAVPSYSCGMGCKGCTLSSNCNTTKKEV